MTGRLVAILALTMMFVLTSCQHRTEEPITLVFWSTAEGKEEAFLRNKLRSFEADNLGIHVEMVRIPFYSASTQFKTAMLGDQTIDIFRADNSWIPEYAELELLAPLGTFASPEDTEGLFPSLLGSVTYQGQLYGLPTVLETPALLYNKRLLEESGFNRAPETIDELLAYAKVLTKEGQYGLFVSSDAYFALPYLAAFGGGTITDDRKIEITSVNSLQALAFMQKLRQEKVTQNYPTFTDSYNTMMLDFKAGRVAMTVNGPWAISDLTTGSEFLNSANLGVAPFPKGPNGQASPIGGHSFVIPRYSKHSEAAYKLIRYLTSLEAQIEQAKVLQTLPTRQEAYEVPELASDPILNGFKAQLEKTQTRPLIPEGSKMFVDFNPILGDILQDKITVEEGAAKLEEAWRSLLRKGG